MKIYNLNKKKQTSIKTKIICSIVKLKTILFRTKNFASYELTKNITNLSHESNSANIPQYVLRDISLEISPGTINTIIGPNGAGKSTLARIIAGIDKNYVGAVHSSFKKIAYLPQFTQLNHSLTINPDSLIALMTKSLRDSSAISRLKNLILGVENIDISRLSGGNLKKLLIYCTMMNDHDLIILDEPNQNLDIGSERLLYEIILMLKEHYGTTFLLISHDMHAVMQYSNQVICINKHICCHGKPEEIKRNDDFLMMYSHIHDCQKTQAHL